MNALVALLPPTLPGIEPVLPTLGTGEAGDLFAALLAGQLTAPPPALPATLPATPAFEAEAALPPSAARSDMPALFDSATETPEASFRTHHWLDSAGPNPAAPDDQIDQAAAADRPVTASPVAPGGPMAATDLAADPVSHPRDAILPLDADGQPRPTVPVPVMPSAIALGAPTLPPAAEALPILPVDASAARIAPAKRIQPAPTAASAATASSAPVDDPDVATSPRPDRTATAAGSEPLPRPAPDLGPALRPDPRLGPKPDVRPDQAPTSIATRVEPRTASSAGTGQPALADLQIEPTIEVREGPITTRTERAAIETAAPVRAPNPPPVVQIGLQIAKAASQQVERLLVQLEPAELGRVEVRLEFGQESRVSAIIAAERPETLDALQRDVRLLERGLQDAGLRLDSNSLSFSLKHEQGQGDGRHFSEHAADAGTDPADRTPSHTEDAAPSGSAWSSAGLRLLDIQA